MAQTANIEAGTARALTDKEAMKVSVGALIGTAMEWYDFFLFSAAAALVFNVQYFSNENATAAALASFATFGVGLVARPVGGMIFGSMGDKIGRRKTLMVTIVGIGIITGLIGALPTYAAIGIAAPVLLVLLRSHDHRRRECTAGTPGPLRGLPADRLPNRNHSVFGRLLRHDADLLPGEL